jgi:LysR family transcriptional regulator, hypochlorite-specific transcription factor HypT
MQLKWLEDFVALSETRNFTRAAELRHVTHPAFGRRIRSLEQWVGVPLLDRTRFPAALTPEGETFLESARAALVALRAGREAANTAVRGAPDIVRIATGPTVGHTHFPQWLARVQAHIGNFQTSIFTGSVQEAFVRLTEGHVDFALTYGHPQLSVELDVKRFTSHDLAQERMVAVVAYDSPFKLPGTPKKPVPLLRLAPSLAMAHIVEGRLQSTPRIYTRTAQMADSAHTVLHFVRAGLGIAWLPEGLVQEDVRARRVRRLEAEYELPLVVRLYRPLGTSASLLEKIWQASQLSKE